MFGIRRIHDDILPRNKTAIAEVQAMLRDQFSGVPSEEIDTLPQQLRNPFTRQFRCVLYVAENARGRLLGFALVMHDPELHFSFLDFLVTARPINGRGIGAALYEYLRDEALGLGALGVFFECLPDDPDRCRDPRVRKQNVARLRFYERYGARPLAGTAYESPTAPGDDDNLPHLVFDGLDRDTPLLRADARRVVRAILERKYRALCSPEYVERVVRSFRSDPVLVRDARSRPAPPGRRASARPYPPMALVINDKHDIHHVRERGYVEAPVRISVIRQELLAAGLADVLPVRRYPSRHLTAVHDRDFVHYLRRVCENTPEGKSVYPYVFPIRNATRPPKELSIRAGYYCIDTFTPLNRSALLAARRAVDCALTAADAMLAGHRVAYALVRPPGHHAERRTFGGFCYFNNTAVAAEYLSRLGKVAILDIDYHHGNGQQDIFYERPDVFTVSIHGDPDVAYPYFSGFTDETGAGAGDGYNLNIPLPETQNGDQYRRGLTRALRAIRDFGPTCLVVALGLDPAKGDPTGTWHLTPADFRENGRLIGALSRPTLVIQEGGYRTRTLGVNARHFFQGLLESAHRP